MLGGVLTLLFVGSAALSLVWTPWPATEIDVPNKLALPGGAHWLGTDSLGRDIVSQLLVGARTSILVGVVAVLIGLSCGVALGCLACGAAVCCADRRASAAHANRRRCRR